MDAFTKYLANNSYSGNSLRTHPSAVKNVLSRIGSKPGIFGDLVTKKNTVKLIAWRHLLANHCEQLRFGCASCAQNARHASCRT